MTQVRLDQVMGFDDVAPYGVGIGELLFEWSALAWEGCGFDVEP